MRKLFFCLLSVVLYFQCTTLAAQAPAGINYQGVARDREGKPLGNRDIAVRISILQTDQSGPVEYSEVHQVTTNPFGLFMLVIGQGRATTGNFAFVSWAVGNKWLKIELDPEGGNAFQMMGSQQLMSVPYAFYAQYSGNGLTAGSGINITNSVITNTGDADNNPGNELVTNLALGADYKLRLTEGSNTREADLSSLLGSGQSLDQVLTNGNQAGGKKIENLANPTAPQDAANKQYVDNHADADADATNEIQQLSLAAHSLSLSKTASPVNLLPYLDNTDAQTLMLTGTNLTISGGNTVELGALNTDAQTLSTQSVDANTRSITISGGNTANLDVRDADASATNELQNLSLSANTLSLSGSAATVDLSGYLDNTDAQTLATQSVDANTRSIAISGGNTTNLDVRDADASATNELQNLSLSANTLSLSGSAATVNLAPYLDNTDAQTLATQSVDANTRSIAISGGNTTNLDVRDADASATNELQNLSLSANTLSLSGSAATVNLAPYLDNTDAQTLATQSVDANTRSIAISGGNTLNLDVRDADASATNELQNLSINANTLSLSGSAATVNLAGYLDNTDAQTLATQSVDANTRSIAISGGNTLNVDVRDADASATNELQTLAQVLAQGASAAGGRIQNVGTPTAAADATTKQYVDDADAALASRISTTYAFKTSFAFNNTSGLVVNDQTLPFTTEEFDDFNVLGTNSFTATENGVYQFVVDGSYAALAAGGQLSFLFNGVKYPVAIVQPFGVTLLRYNATQMFKLTAGQTVTLVADNIPVGAQFNGSFFGYKL